jgi:hypothetical protein
MLETYLRTVDWLAQQQLWGTVWTTDYVWRILLGGGTEAASKTWR